MVTSSGVSVRPEGSDRYGPAVGTRVSWHLSQPVIDLAAQAQTLGWAVLGTIGNSDHLRKHGDHSPWSLGKVPGIIYAVDLAAPDAFEQWLIATCRSTYDTTWIDFWNMRGSQYDNAGTRIASSGDEHLHLSVAKGYEDRRVTLFADYAGKAKTTTGGGAVADRSEDIYTLLHDGRRPGPNQTSGGGVPIAWVARRFAELESKLDQIMERLDSAGRPPAA